MQILGIDPSLTATGFAWRNAKGKWQVYLVPGRDWKGCRAVIGEAHREGCRAACIEDVFVGPSARTSLRLARLGGQIELACLYRGIEFCLVSPRTWQQDMLNYGKDSKKQSVLAAKSLGANINIKKTRLGLVPDDNLADAVNISEWGKLNWDIEG